MKKILIILVILILLGGGAYYEFVYAPPVYSKAVLGVIKEFETANQTIPRPESISEPADKIVAIKQQSDFLKQAKDKLLRLSPPFFGKLRQFHNDLLGMIDLWLTPSSQQEEQIAFFGGILELEAVLEPKHLDRSTATIGDMQRYLENAIPKIQMQIDEIISKEPSFEFRGATFSEIRSAWQEARPGFDVWLGFVRKLNPEQPLDGSSGVDTPRPTKKEEGAVFNITKFIDLVKKAAASNIGTSQLSSPSDEESDAREQRINKVIDELQDKYPN